MRLLSVLLSALCCCSAANASVVYNWHGNNDKAPFNIQMQLVFTDAIVASGSMSLDTRGGMYGMYPESGLLHIFYTFPGNYVPIDVAPAIKPLGQTDELEMSLQFLSDGTLSGYIDALNFDSNIGMASAGSLFTVYASNSDGGMEQAGCPRPDSCAGATGRFLRVGSEVPEPGVLALLGIGFIALRRNRRHV